MFNVLGFILTTNHKTDGIYLPADDRRHYVAWSALTKEDFQPQYWQELWGWYYAGGFEHVAAYLAELDLSGFRPEGAAAEDAGVLGHRQRQSSAEDAELADVLDELGNPEAVTPKQLLAKATGQLRNG